ncbi:MAG: DUF5989 family protein [Verrucomicrobiota bacterium]
MSDEPKKSFAEAGEQKDMSLVQEFFLMLKENKKYWMIPLVVMLLLLGLLVILGGTGAAPFIYTLF